MRSSIQHLTKGSLSNLARNFHSSGPRQDAVHYIQAYPHLFDGDHGNLLNKHSTLLHKMNDIGKHYFSTASNNTQIRAIYAGTKGMENELGESAHEFQKKHVEFTDKRKDLVKEYNQELLNSNQNVDSSETAFVEREVLKYIARGQMLIQGDKSTLDDIHTSSSQKYGNALGPTLDSLKSKPNYDITASAGRKRDFSTLKDDLKKLKSETQAQNTQTEQITPENIEPKPR